ncbi:MAG: ATP-binding cassette domain-containing protein [Proteobacteria bacterium]|nr:ATP-binding cassette domain-containing protein [Pseudomonadota bacterium]
MGDTRLLARYHRLIIPFIGVFLVAILFDIVTTLIGLVTPLFTRILFDYAYPLRDLKLLNLTIFSIIGLYFLTFFINVMGDYLSTYIGQEADARLTERVFHKIQCLPISFHQKKKIGDLLIRITDDVDTTVGMVFNTLPTFIIDGGRFFIILAIALSINVKLTMLALLSVPLYVIEATYFAGKRARLQEEQIEASSIMYSRANEKLANIKTIKAFGQEDQESLSFSRIIRKQFRIGVKGKLLEIFQTFTSSLTLQMWSVFLTWYLGYQVVQGQLTIGEIVALMMYIDQLDGPVHSFIGMFTQWKTNLISVKRIDEVLSHPTEEEGIHGTAALNIKDGEVGTTHLSFAYAPENEILHDIEISFPPNSFTALVGGSGSGKTTLVNLLLRFFDPTQGIILVDGQNIMEVRVRDLRQKIGIVAQDAALFDGTVMDNILYGNEGKERGEAMRAAQLAGAHDFIMRLPGGYDAQVGESGSLLSGGQKQRIAIARTLLRNPAVVIFDEATSALDAESEFRIQETIGKLRATKTVIVIAHRLSTIKMADAILVLDEGKFVEKGTFDELFDRKGVFYKFYWKQFGGLASVRQQLVLELERASRYGSKFCLAMMRVLSYGRICKEAGVEAGDRFIEAVDMLLKRSIRMGDNCAVLDGDTIMLILPEIDAAQLEAFFKRMIATLPRKAGDDLEFDLAAEELLFVGTTVSKKLFKTVEELMHALKNAADSSGEPGYRIIAGDDLAAGAAKG